MYKTPNQRYQLLEDVTIHNLEWSPDKRAMQKRINVNSVDHDPSEEVAALVVITRQMKERLKH